MKNFNYAFRNRTHNPLVVQPEQTVPLYAPQVMIMLIELNAFLCLEVNCFCKKITTSF